MGNAGQTAQSGVRLSRDYVALQVLFAEEMARKSGRHLADTLLHCTNIHRRLGLGKPGAPPYAPEWLALVEGAEHLDHDQRIDRFFDALNARPDGAAVLLPGRIQFGCFACEAPDALGGVRIHFGNRETSDGVGPLHSSRIEARRAELRAMFGWLASDYPEASHVNGGSWLYNLDAYRRLFPPAFGASRQADPAFNSMSGLSTWGQFIRHDSSIRPDVRDAFLAALPDLDPDKPSGPFPYKVLFTQAPIEAFRRFYSA
jgi:hypothetical protein